MPTQIRRRFDRAGATYEAAALVQRQVATQLAGLCPDVLTGSVLEIGAGSGLLTRKLLARHGAGTPGASGTGAAEGTGGVYVALDLSPGMLVHATTPGARKVAADGERPPFAPATFDFLASASAMHWYADPAKSIPQNLSLIKPGGGFALALYVEGTLCELEETATATGFGSVFPMRPAGFYRTLFESLPGMEWSMEEARHEVRHESVATLLRSLKGAGVTHTPGKRAGSPSRYREFTRYYTERFGVAGGVTGGVTASYAVIYCVGRRFVEAG
jgi:malonyl-CoA O-methyltransferase